MEWVALAVALLVMAPAAALPLLLFAEEAMNAPLGLSGLMAGALLSAGMMAAAAQIRRPPHRPWLR